MALKNVARFVMGHGGLSLVRARNRNAVRILMYHRFAGMEDAFAAQCDDLLRHYQPLALGELCRRLLHQEPLPHNAVVITVDDGYRDFYTSAFPILEARRIPATVFLVTDFLDGRLWLWTDHIQYAIERSSRTEVEIAFATGEKVRLPLKGKEQQRAAVSFLKEKLKNAPDDLRRTILKSLPEQLGVSIPEEAPAGCEPLRWDEVRGMCHAGIEFGGHTKTHPILSRLETSEALTTEIAGCRKRLEEELQAPVRHFCYPNGRPEDVGAAVIAATRQAGFESAVTTVPGLTNSNADIFMLQRIAVKPDLPRQWFAEAVAGFRLAERYA